MERELPLSAHSDLSRPARDPLPDLHREHFLALLGHELRNPLTALRNGLFIVSVEPGSSEGFRQALSMMDRQLAYLQRLVDDFTEVGRLGSGRLELRPARVSLKKVLGTSIECCQASVAVRRQQLRCELPSEDVIVRGDGDRLVQVFSNLLTNSIKFTPPGGHISVSLARECGFAQVQVSDDGVGIPREKVDRVFDLFSQLEEPGPGHSGNRGLGIGLSLVRSLVELHGGRVEARSDGIGMGSTFSVRLPEECPGEIVANEAGDR